MFRLCQRRLAAFTADEFQALTTRVTNLARDQPVAARELLALVPGPVLAVAVKSPR